MRAELVSLLRTDWSAWSETPGQLQPNRLVNIAEIRTQSGGRCPIYRITCTARRLLREERRITKSLRGSRWRQAQARQRPSLERVSRRSVPDRLEDSIERSRTYTQHFDGFCVIPSRATERLPFLLLVVDRS